MTLSPHTSNTSRNHVQGFLCQIRQGYFFSAAASWTLFGRGLALIFQTSNKLFDVRRHVVCLIKARQISLKQGLQIGRLITLNLKPNCVLANVWNFN